MCISRVSREQHDASTITQLQRAAPGETCCSITQCTCQKESHGSYPIGAAVH
jgi:hypothetical protein